MCTKRRSWSVDQKFRIIQESDPMKLTLSKMNIFVCAK